MKKMTLQNMHEWPLMTRVLILGLVFAASLYLGYRFDLSRQMQNLLKTGHAEKDLRDQLDLVVQKRKLVETVVAQLPAMQAKFDGWKKQLVDYDDLPQLLNQILKIGGDNHLFFSLFTPGETTEVIIPPPSPPAPADAAAGAPPPAPPAPSAPPQDPPQAQAQAAPQNSDAVTYIKVPIKAVVMGDFHQISDFISQLANLSTIVVIGDFTLTNDNSASALGDKLAKLAAAQHLLSAEITLEIYYLAERKKQ